VSHPACASLMDRPSRTDVEVPFVRDNLFVRVYTLVSATRLADLAALSLASGLRRTSPGWNGEKSIWCDVWRGFVPDQTNARKAVPVPLNADAMAIIRRPLGRHATPVYCFRRKLIHQVSINAWYQALQRGGIQVFRWHDLTRPQVGTCTAGRLCSYCRVGRMGPEMLRRCAHLSAEHLAPYAD
jgi:hypothetical protein